MNPEGSKQGNIPPRHPEQAVPTELNRGKEQGKEMTQSAEPKGNKPYDEFLGRAQKAYSAYLDAQKDIWVAYGETEQKTEEDFIKSQTNAYAVLNKTLGVAVQSQKATEKQAEEIYQKAKEQSKVVYDQNVQQAMNEFNSAVKQAWEQRKATLAQARGIFVK
jgi:hypothetical protein